MRPLHESSRGEHHHEGQGRNGDKGGCREGSCGRVERDGDRDRDRGFEEDQAVEAADRVDHAKDDRLEPFVGDEGTASR